MSATPTRKIVLATGIVGLGLLIAWPLRKSPAPPAPPTEPVDKPAPSVVESPPTAGFDLADHPALRPVEGAEPGHAITPLEPSPLRASAVGERHRLESPPVGSVVSWPEERIHVVHNGDTLEKLAERYLGSPLRAGEIFDLNRDRLKNPHVLPIGAELRIPNSGSEGL